MARYGTAHHIEQMVRNYRRCQRLKLLHEDRRNHALREISWHLDDDGCWVMKGRFTPEQGALIQKALERLAEALLAGESATAAGGDRYLINIHTKSDVLQADGGKTAMDNLVLLCKRHHRLVHEGGFGVHVGAGNEIWLSYPTGDTLPSTADGRFRGNAERVRALSAQKSLEITPRTLQPEWGDGPMDYNYAQQLLEQYDQEDR